MTGGTLTLEPETILTSDEHTAIFMRVIGERDGKTLNVTLTEAFTIGPTADGTSSGRADDQDAVDAFWS